MAKRILVVDDEPDLVMILRTALQTEGYEVVTASNGPDGLEEASNSEPDLMVLDVMMPGMSGFEVLKKLKEEPKTSQIPVIMLTGVSEREKIQEALSSGIDYYLIKPFEFDELIEKIARALEGFEA